MRIWHLFTAIQQGGKDAAKKGEVDQTVVDLVKRLQTTYIKVCSVIKLIIKIGLSSPAVATVALQYF